MRRAYINDTHITKLGHIQVQMAKVIDAEGEEVFIGWHRTVVEVGGDVDAQMTAVNLHLIQMGFAGIQAEEIAELKKYAAIAFTPKKIKAYRDGVAAAQKALAGQIAADKPIAAVPPPQQ